MTLSVKAYMRTNTGAFAPIVLEELGVTPFESMRELGRDHCPHIHPVLRELWLAMFIDPIPPLQHWTAPHPTSFMWAR